MQSLPVNKIPGVGKVTAQKLQTKGMTTCGELQTLSDTELTQWLGKFGQQLYHYCRGEDERPVQTSRTRKSLSVETTFQQDLKTIDACQ